MPYAPLLSPPEVQERLQALQGWRLDGNAILKRFRFRGFAQALAFVNRVGELAEAVDHHPDIIINYNRVSLSLTTHASKGLTHKDFDLAHQIDALPV
ncbi:MAG: 4a-hydroxytetrahydrobiopterin dehydratase [Chloroflexi bacterium]|nr:4a-hydroxytetrahydrobiopterin dehydratase [Chloroflexota bacterium]